MRSIHLTAQSIKQAPRLRVCVSTVSQRQPVCCASPSKEGEAGQGQLLWRAKNNPRVERTATAPSRAEASKMPSAQHDSAVAFGHLRSQFDPTNLVSPPFTFDRHNSQVGGRIVASIWGEKVSTPRRLRHYPASTSRRVSTQHQQRMQQRSARRRAPLILALLLAGVVEAFFLQPQLPRAASTARNGTWVVERRLEAR